MTNKIEDFIKKCNEKFKDKFDYSITKYKKTNGYITFVCPIHGITNQRADHHLSSKFGCRECSIDAKKTTEQNFINKAKKRFKTKYDYNLVKFFDINTEVDIICPIHGVFKKTPNQHIKGKQGCEKCNKYHKLTNNDVIAQFKKQHGDLYDYSKVNYVNELTKISVICKKHGEFKILPLNHKRGVGCKKCIEHFRKFTKESILERFTKIHGDKYEYKLNSPVIVDNKIIVINKHYNSEHLITPRSLLNGTKCSMINAINKTDYIIKEFQEKHENEYDYYKVKYISDSKKITIVCKKHGDFKTSPRNHLNGCGCPICKESKGERKIRIILNKNKINYKLQYNFDDCIYKRKLFFDFYLIDLNTCIEFNGEQHYVPYRFLEEDKSFQLRQKRDNIKKEYCEKNNIPFFIIRYDEDVLGKLIEYKIIPKL